MNVFAVKSAGEPEATSADSPLIAAAKSLNGCLNAFIGPSGCGKTDLAIRLSIAAAYFNQVPWFAYDANGDVRTTLAGIREFHAKELTELERLDATNDPKERDRRAKSMIANKRRLDFAERCNRADRIFEGVDQLPTLLSQIQGWVAQGMRDSKAGMLRKPRAIIFIDEAGSVRDSDEHFWPRMRMGRNAGLTFYATGHRTTDWHPAALAVIRIAVLWKPVDRKKWDLGIVSVDGSKCTEARSNKIRYIVGDNPTLIEWDRDKNPGYPAALIVPAQPTKSRVAGI